MKVSIMQPYFFPYIGYFQLINAVDVFVVYDNIQFTKKGWFHRNRILVGGKDKMFSIPLKKDSDYLNVVQRVLADNFDIEKKRILRRIAQSYHKAPYYNDVMPLVEECFQKGSGNLFEFIYASLRRIIQFLHIETEMMISSSIAIDHTLKSQQKVLNICTSIGADVYINPIGGKELYEVKEFQKQGIKLRFLKAKPFTYVQFGNEFLPWLSIIDVMMFNPPETIRQCVESNYELI